MPAPVGTLLIRAGKLVIRNGKLRISNGVDSSCCCDGVITPCWCYYTIRFDYDCSSEYPMWVGTQVNNDCATHNQPVGWVQGDLWNNGDGTYTQWYNYFTHNECTNSGDPENPFCDNGLCSELDQAFIDAFAETLTPIDCCNGLCNPTTTITPDISIGSMGDTNPTISRSFTAWFCNEKIFPAGTYYIRYVTGAAKLATSGTNSGYTVNQYNPDYSSINPLWVPGSFGYHIVTSDSAIDVHGPGVDYTDPTDQTRTDAAVVAASSGMYVMITLTSPAKIGMNFSDVVFTDNSPSPTYGFPTFCITNTAPPP